MSVSSPATFSDVSAMTSDKSTGEDGIELSEMQRVTLMFHMLEHMVFPAAIFTREIKSSTIAFAKETMGMHVTVTGIVNFTFETCTTASWSMRSGFI